VPRFIGNPVRVSRRKRKSESKIASMSLEPFERRGLGETFFERRIVGGGDVDGSSGMMLAVAWSGDEAKNVGQV